MFFHNKRAEMLKVHLQNERQFSKITITESAFILFSDKKIAYFW